MKSIYKNTKRTLIWLGPDEDGCAKTALPLIHQYALAAASQLGFSLSDLAKQRFEDFWDRPTDLGKLGPAWSESETAAVKHLFSHSWFKRLWVVQELTLSDSPVVCWGKESQNALEVLFAADMLRMSYSHVSEDFDIRDDTFVDEASNMLDETVRNPDYNTILQSLRIAQTYEATDRRDVIYAMMSHPWLEKHMTPDYSISTTDLYTMFACKCLDSFNSLNVLSYSIHKLFDKDNLCKPTWVPQWDADIINYMPIWFKGANVNACGNYKKPIWKYVGSTIELKGVIWDHVCEPIQLSRSDLWISKPYGDHKAMVTAWTDLLHKIQNCCFPSGDKIDELERILTCDWPTLDTSKASLYQFLHRSLGSNVLGRLGLGMEEEDAGEVEPLVDHTDWCEFYDGRISNMLGYRTLFTTSKGYLGMSSYLSQPGDIVAILAGGIVPYVLRKETDTTWILIGEAYIGGIMLGEVMDDWKNGKHPDLKWETIILE
jgi:hypothetical protein